MDRIMIVTSRPKPDVGLLEWLNTLFPDCEIQIVFSAGDAFDVCQADPPSEPFRMERTGRT
ncbi:MAG: hypothetical protein KAT27_07965 [Desulfobacterales bacterium]|nr:hypothetical protein [Desulfobacterales bacterium]